MQDASAAERIRLKFRTLVPVMDERMRRQWAAAEAIAVGRGDRRRPGRDRDGGGGQPTTDMGTGAVQEKERARLAEIIEKVNDLFDGDLSPQDKLVWLMYRVCCCE